MTQVYSTQNDLLLNNLLEFYKGNDNMDKMLNIINGESRISLRIIDWFATNWMEFVECAWQEPYKISDHKIQATRLQMHDRKGAKVGSLKRGPDWRRPKVY